MENMIGVFCLGIYGKLMSLHVYPMISLYPMESMDLRSRYLSLALWIKTGAQSRGQASNIFLNAILVNYHMNIA